MYMKANRHKINKPHTGAAKRKIRCLTETTISTPSDTSRVSGRIRSLATTRADGSRKALSAQAQDLQEEYHVLILLYEVWRMRPPAARHSNHANTARPRGGPPTGGAKSPPRGLATSSTASADALAASLTVAQSWQAIRERWEAYRFSRMN